MLVSFSDLQREEATLTDKTYRFCNGPSLEYRLAVQCRCCDYGIWYSYQLKLHYMIAQGSVYIQMQYPAWSRFSTTRQPPILPDLAVLPLLCWLSASRLPLTMSASGPPLCPCAPMPLSTSSSSARRNRSLTCYLSRTRDRSFSGPSQRLDATKQPP